VLNHCDCVRIPGRVPYKLRFTLCNMGSIRDERGDDVVLMSRGVVTYGNLDYVLCVHSVNQENGLLLREGFYLSSAG
jgi:hypothetical protein